MHRFSPLVTVIAAVVLGSAAAGHAADFCIEVNSVVLVGKQVRIPPKGNCKTWKGFMLNDCPNAVSTGTICRDSDDSRVDISIMTSCPGSIVFHDHVTLPYPSLTGGTDIFSFFDVGSGGFQAPFPANKVPCEPKKVPFSRQGTGGPLSSRASR